MGRGYSEAQMGILTGAMALGNLTGAIPAGKLIERVGLRNALLGCLFFAPTILCARSLFPAYALQIPIAVIAGMALSLWAVCVSPAVASTTSERERPFAFGLLFSFGIGLGALGALAASRLPSWFAEHSGHMHLAASDQLALIASCCFAILAVIPAAALSESRPTVSAAQRPLLSRALLRFLPAVGLWGLVTGSFSPFANVFFAGHLHLQLRQIGTIFSVSQLAQVAAVLCAPLIFRRWGVTAGIVAAQSATALCFLLLASFSHSAIASSVYVTLTALQWMNEPGIYSMLMSIAPEEHRGGASASMSFTLSSSQLVAAVTAGWAFKNFGYPPTFCAIAIIAIMAAGMFAVNPKPKSIPAPSYASEGPAT